MAAGGLIAVISAGLTAKVKENREFSPDCDVARTLAKILGITCALSDSGLPAQCPNIADTSRS